MGIPPGKCTPETRWFPRDVEEVPVRQVGMVVASSSGSPPEPPIGLNSEEPSDEHLPSSTGNLASSVNMSRTGRCFGGFVRDIRFPLKLGFIYFSSYS